MTKSIEEEKIIGTFKQLITAENSHRSPKVRKKLRNLHQEIDSAPISSQLMPILKLYVLLSNYGGKKPLEKEKQYEGRYHAKVWVDSPKEKTNEGSYKKHGIQLNEDLENGRKMLFVIIHEIIHYITNQLYENAIPNPGTAWNRLTKLLRLDMTSDIKGKDETKIFKEIFSLYKKKERTAEILPHLGEYLLNYQQLPSSEQGFQKSAPLIEKLFQKFLADVNVYTQLLEKDIIEEKALCKLDLYQTVIQSDSIPPPHLQKEIRTQRNIGFYPLHIAAQHGYIKLTQWLIESKQCKIDEPDKFGNKALHIALESGKLEIASYFIKKAPLIVLFSLNESGKSVFKLAKDHCPAARKALMERADYMSALIQTVRCETQLKEVIDFFIEAIDNASDNKSVNNILRNAKEDFDMLVIPNKKNYIQELELYAIIKKFALADSKTIQKMTHKTVNLIKDEKNPKKIDEIVGAAQIGLAQSKISSKDYIKTIQETAGTRIYSLFPSRIPKTMEEKNSTPESRTFGF